MGQCLPTQQALPPADLSSSSTSQPAISATFYNHNDVIQNTLVVNSNDDHYYDINIFNFPNYHPTTAGSSTNYHSHRAGWPENNSAPFPPPSVLVQRMERLGMEAAPPGHDDSPKKVNRYVDVRKDTLQLVLDEDLSSYLVSFTFDALVDGRYIFIFYFSGFLFTFIMRLVNVSWICSIPILIALVMYIADLAGHTNNFFFFFWK